MLIPGIPIRLGETEYVVPPLNLGAIEALQDRIEGFDKVSITDRLRTVVDAAWYALRRNYPELEKDVVKEFVDVGNMKEVMEAVMDVGGLRRRAYEEGKAKAVGSPSGGPISTAT